ncbi:SUMF1/EgtB/PvdO family nonheme iron enzyme [Streptomyces sp. NPDC001142]
MPHERGGRLHYDPAGRRWRVSSGYESHPAYWVTWIGAAFMAAWSGARLPTRAEALRATKGARAHNTDYLVGDVCPVAEPGLGDREIHHAVGNVQIWCADGPEQPEAQPVQRYLFGAAWNTPSTEEAVTAIRSRYLLGSSRGVGIRLVRDPAPRTPPGSGHGSWHTGSTAGPTPSTTPHEPRRAGSTACCSARWAHRPIADFGPMYEPAPGNSSLHSFTNRSLNPRAGKSSSATNSTPRIGRLSAPSSTTPISPPTRRASKVM